jgi:signal transduction histidine kinase
VSAKASLTDQLGAGLAGLAQPLLRVRVPFRLRFFFRGAFFLLALATLALAVTVLQEEKQIAHRNYQEGLTKNQAQIAARLRHPTGQLALLNPAATERPALPLRPVVLPFSAIDFDDRVKVQQAVEMAGCAVQYAGGETMCVAVGSNPAAGGFIYVAGSFAAGDLVSHRQGDLDITSAHRVRVVVNTPQERFAWIAPFETLDAAASSANASLTEQAASAAAGTPAASAPEAASAAAAALPAPRYQPVRGRLTGYVDGVPIVHGTKFVRDFRGWLWQDGRCVEGPAAAAANCARRSYLSVRLPVEVWRDRIWRQPQPVWPPPELDAITVQVTVLPPGEAATALFDSNAGQATPSFSLADLRSLLLPGETLAIRQLRGSGPARELLTLKGPVATDEPSSPWLLRLIARLPGAEAAGTGAATLAAREELGTPLGRYELLLTGDLRSVNQQLAAVATRVSWFVLAMLGAVLLTWAAIELRIIRRITTLTRRAATVSRGVRVADGLAQMDLSDLRGRDELGVLAGGLQDLLQRVNEDVRREHIRAEQEKDQWHAVGHEIMSPLQSLMALHPDPADPSHRYIGRMQQAIRVLYGSASPSEAFQSKTLEVAPLDWHQFLRHVADNAPLEGIAKVQLQADTDGPVWVAADEYALEDVVTHVLRNADRHRLPGTPITLRLQAQPPQLVIHNQGAPIAEDMLDKIFEYGVSDQPDAGAAGSRGQGLFVAKTYMAKMGGTIEARNVSGGVEFALSLPPANPA